jgi:hypothetical protein
MKISEKTRAELKLYAQAAFFEGRKENPFLQNVNADVDAYIAFNNQFNEFINHSSRPFRPIIEEDIKL